MAYRILISGIFTFSKRYQLTDMDVIRTLGLGPDFILRAIAGLVIRRIAHLPCVFALTRTTNRSVVTATFGAISHDGSPVSPQAQEIPSLRWVLGNGHSYPLSAVT